MGRTYTRKIGDSTLRVVDNFPSMAKLLKIGRIASDAGAKAGAKQAKWEAQQILRGMGGERARWEPNAPLTKRLKGHGKQLLGTTGTLRDGVEVQSAGPDGRYNVGWFGDKIHPYTNDKWKRSSQPRTIVEVATIQEFGGPINVFGNDAEIPARPHLSQVADNPERAERVVGVMWQAYLERLKSLLEGHFYEAPESLFGSSLLRKIGGR